MPCTRIKIYSPGSDLVRAPQNLSGLTAHRQVRVHRDSAPSAGQEQPHEERAASHRRRVRGGGADHAGDEILSLCDDGERGEEPTVPDRALPDVRWCERGNSSLDPLRKFEPRGLETSPLHRPGRVGARRVVGPLEKFALHRTPAPFPVSLLLRLHPRTLPPVRRLVPARVERASVVGSVLVYRLDPRADPTAAPRYALGVDVDSFPVYATRVRRELQRLRTCRHPRRHPRGT